jgi:hypothetical protein
VPYFPYQENSNTLSLNSSLEDDNLSSDDGFEAFLKNKNIVEEPNFPSVDIKGLTIDESLGLPEIQVPLEALKPTLVSLYPDSDLPILDDLFEKGEAYVEPDQYELRKDYFVSRLSSNDMDLRAKFLKSEEEIKELKTEINEVVATLRSLEGSRSCCSLEKDPKNDLVVKPSDSSFENADGINKQNTKDNEVITIF